MEKLLQLINEAYQELRALITEYKQNLASLEVRENAHAENSKSVDERVQDISNREAVLEPVENFRKEQKALAAAQDKLSEDRSNFENEKQNFKTHSEAVRQTNETRARDLDEQQKYVELGKKRIKEEIDRGIAEFVAKFKKE